MGHFLLKEPTDLFSGNVTIQYGESSTPLSFTLVACKGLTCFVIFLFLIDSDAKLIWFPQSPWSTTGGVPFFFFFRSPPQHPVSGVRVSGVHLSGASIRDLCSGCGQ